MKKLLALLLALVLCLGALVACDTPEESSSSSSEESSNQEPSIKKIDTNITVQLLEQEVAVIEKIFNEGEWTNDVTKTAPDYILSFSGLEIKYSLVGIFNDWGNDQEGDERCLYLSNEEIAQINVIIESHFGEASCEQEKEFDSVNLPEQIYSNFETPGKYFIAKAWLSSNIYDIYDDNKDIKSPFDESNYMQGVYYFSLYKENAEGYFMHYDENGKFNYFPTSAAEKDYNDFFEYARYPEKALGDSIRVENMYCFVNGDGYTEWWILYETKNGPDYVLLKEREGREKIYLFTYEELEPMARELRDHRWLNRYNDGISILSTVADISKYEITPRDMIKEN